MCFVLVGSVANSSRVATICLRTFCVSTSGAAPLTVIVSSSAPTRISALTVAVKPGRELDALPPEDAEPGEREGDGVGAGPQVDDVVAALAVARDGADLFDERGAGGFDRHPGQDSAGRVFDDSGDAAGLLRRRGDRPE